MAALTMTPPTRQPFASLDSPRMHNVLRSSLNRQNRQNGALTMKPAIFADADSENIDPSTLTLSSKRKRTFDDDDDVAKGSPKPLKTSRIALTTRGINNASPRTSTPKNIVPSTPKSAPILKPAGRSPPPKSYKTSSRRSTITKTRPEPSKRGVTRPFSIATALSQSKPVKPQTKAPSSWFFDIHVDTEEEEMTNLMQHSTGVLDISDDESKGSPSDGRGKENVPPAELGIDLPHSRASTSAATTTARTASKMDEDRAPLGELTASDFYPEDCNAFSYAVVYDDENETVSEKKTAASTPASQTASISPAITTSIASLLETALPPKRAVEPTNTNGNGDTEDGSAAEKPASTTKD
ncbi:hypothetical protein N7492_000100 [Penicillium capsulatum]|uniref:Uncharacterized protein n=1 Tax=Penicillium capsulatum TaxID=69766 RepID=A0A9W9LZ21_9EURO|nr:hypothetical protein N7492_000100 [Penicillium capsulatum]KAJ6130832.1 hypothetical protein N7512_003612 [Penicillium capsulatum]